MPTLDYILHYHGVRIRARGSGNLDLTFLSLDSIYEQTLTTIAMTSTSARPVTKLANFKQPRACLKIQTDAIDETFVVNQISVYVKPLYTSYPQ